MLGSSISLSGTSYIVIGVMPDEFNLPGGTTDIWVNFNDDQKMRETRESGWLMVMALLREGTSFESATVEMDALALRIIEEHPEEAGKGVAMFPFRDLVVSRASAGIWILVAAVGMVLLIACANIAGLLLVRSTDRRRELAVRLALGSGRGRLITQSLTETGLIALVGGLLGYGAAVLAIGPFLDAFPGGLPRASEVAIDYRVLLITVGLAGLTSLLTGILPALLGARTEVSDTLRGSGKSVAGGRGQSRIQAVLVTSEVTLAVFLLVVAGLFVRSFTGMSRVDPGFEVEGILTSSIVLPAQYRDPPEAGEAFFRDLYDCLEAIPGISSVVGATQMPYAGGYSTPPVRAEGNAGYVDGTAHISQATPGYFAAMGISWTKFPSSRRIIVLKTTGDAALLAPQIRQAVWDLDGNVPVSVGSLANRLENSPGLVGARFGSVLLGGLAGVAALLAILGVYAILAYTVAQRTQEIGIQMALGAGAGLVVGRVLRRGLLLGGAGVVLGLGLALAAGRFLESLVFEIRPSDPLTLASVAGLVMAATLVAAWLPARRAVRIDPVDALRME